MGPNLVKNTRMDKYLVKIDPKHLKIGHYYVFKYDIPFPVGDDPDFIRPEENINKREGILRRITVNPHEGYTYYTFENITYKDEPARPTKIRGHYLDMIASNIGEHYLEFYTIPRSAFEAAGTKRRKSKRRKSNRNKKSKRRRR